MPSLLHSGVIHGLKHSKKCTLLTYCRFISTTPCVGQVRPEHPHFIDVPGQAPFQRRLTQRDIKGTLPPPRDVLKTRALRTPKNRPEFILATTPEPRIPRKPKSEFEKWKYRMAESRKKNLRESVLELHNRKMERKKNLKTLRLGRQRRREKLLHAPQLEDERLTNPTVTRPNSTLQNGFLPDPNRTRRLEEMAGRVKAKEEAKVQARKDALHDLYMNARHFITTEQALDARIDLIFTAQPFLKGDHNDNIWDVYGSPPTTRDLLRKDEGGSKVVLDAYESPAVLASNRLQIIAEKLTGGKINTEFIIDKNKKVEEK